MEHSTAKWTTMETRRDTGVPAEHPVCVRVCLFVRPSMTMCPRVHVLLCIKHVFVHSTYGIHTFVFVCREYA